MTLYHEADGIHLWHGDALKVSEFIEPESVDLIVTSPPYFALRSYTDDGEHYEGQIGSEATPREFVDALVACTAEWVKVLKPGGSIWVNLGDKYAGSGGHNNAGVSGGPSQLKSPGRIDALHAQAKASKATRRQSPDRYNQASDGIRAKSLMLLPERYRIRCVDELGLIARAVVIWSKPNGLPESVTDRVRRSHEDWVHLTKEPRYFAAVDEVREPQDSAGERHEGRSGYVNAFGKPGGAGVARAFSERALNPLGKLPGSVWTIPSEPLRIPADAGLEDHFAAFPTEWPRRIILGWSPEGGTVLDPFGGTGTTALVARALGRHAHHVDLSRGYLRTAQWRIWNDDHAFRKASERSGIKVPEAPAIDGQLDLLGGVA